MCTNLGKTALFYSIVTIYLGLRPRIIAAATLSSAADQLKFVSFWNLSFQKKMDRSFLNVQTCEKGEKKERAPMQFWFKEFIACCENDRAPTEEIVWHLKWKSEILCLRIKIHRIEWIVNYLISIHWTNQQLSSRSRAAILTLKFLERSFVDFWKIYSGQWQGHFQNE